MTENIFVVPAPPKVDVARGAMATLATIPEKTSKLPNYGGVRVKAEQWRALWDMNWKITGANDRGEVSRNLASDIMPNSVAKVGEQKAVAYPGDLATDRELAKKPITETMITYDVKLIEEAGERVEAWDRQQKRVQQAEKRAEKMLHVRQNERWQRRVAAIEFLKAKKILMSEGDWKDKVAVLTKLYPWVANVMDLSGQVVTQNQRVLEDLGIDSDKALALAFEDAEAKRHTQNLVDPKEMELARKPKAELGPQEALDREAQIKKTAEDLFKEINELRTKNGEQPLNILEQEQILGEWGVECKVENGKITYLDMRDGGVMQALLIARGVKADGRRAVEANFKVIEAGGEAAGDAVEALDLAINTELNGEIMEYVANAMAAGKMNEPKVQEAIQIARDRGLMDEATALEWGSAQGKKLAKVGSKLIKDSAAKISEFYKELKADPKKLKELKMKLLKGVLALVLVPLVVAIAAASAIADTAGKALGGGR